MYECFSESFSIILNTCTSNFLLLDDPYGGFEEPEFGKAGDEQEDEEEKLEKYKELIKNIKTNEEDKVKKDTELEISWEPGKPSVDLVFILLGPLETETIIGHCGFSI